MGETVVINHWCRPAVRAGQQDLRDPLGTMQVCILFSINVSKNIEILVSFFSVLKRKLPEWQQN